MYNHAWQINSIKAIYDPSIGQNIDFFASCQSNETKKTLEQSCAKVRSFINYQLAYYRAKTYMLAYNWHLLGAS